MQSEINQLDDLCFVDEASWLVRWNYEYAKLLAKLMRITFIWPPVTYKGWKGLLRPPNINILARTLGITDVNATKLIEFHNTRVRRRNLAIIAVYLPVSLFGIAFILMLALPFAEDIAENRTILLSMVVKFLMPLVEVFLALVAMLIFYIYMGAMMKFSATIVDKHFADSLCIRLSLFIMCEMTRDDVLRHPRRRRSVLDRIDDLARLTRLLGVRFSSGSESTREWSWRHFRSLELFVRETEREVIAPTEGTLAKLRERMAFLAEIYIFGQYGDDVWKGKSPDLEPDPGSGWSRWVQHVVGPTVPGALIIVIGLYPDLASTLGVETKTVVLILAAWFILALDASLGIGVVDKLLKTARELRELK